VKVALTGASGFIGRHVLESLVRRGIDVVAVGRSRPQGYFGAFVAADLCGAKDPPDFATLGATHLLHLAWYTEHGKYWTAAENARWAVATHTLVEAFCAAGGEKVVAAGTCAEYEWSGGDCIEEVTALAPDSIYGMAKCLARSLTAETCRAYGMPWAWGRVFMPVGPGENRSRLLPSLMDVFAGKREPFAASLTSERDFLHVADVAEAFVHLLTPEAKGCYNICSGKATRIGDVVALVAAMYSAGPTLISASPSTDPTPRVVGDCSRLRMLGWAPCNALADALQPGKGW